MPKTQILHLTPGGDYKITEGKQRPAWPNLVDTKYGGERQSFHTLQNPVFRINRPLLAQWRATRRCDSWEELVNSEEGPPPPDLDSDRTLMVVFANFPFPLAPAAEMTDQEIYEFGKGFDEEVETRGADQASEEELGYSAKRVAYIMFVSTVFLIAVLVGGIVAYQQFVIEEPAPVPQEQPAQASKE